MKSLLKHPLQQHREDYMSITNGQHTPLNQTESHILPKMDSYSGKSRRELIVALNHELFVTESSRLKLKKK